MISLVFGLFRFEPWAKMYIDRPNLPPHRSSWCQGKRTWGLPREPWQTWVLGCGFVWLPFLSSKVMDITLKLIYIYTWCFRMLKSVRDAKPSIRDATEKLCLFFVSIFKKGGRISPKHRGIRTHAGAVSSWWIPFCSNWCSQVHDVALLFPRSRQKCSWNFDFSSPLGPDNHWFD